MGTFVKNYKKDLIARDFAHFVSSRTGMTFFKEGLFF